MGSSILISFRESNHDVYARRCGYRLRAIINAHRGFLLGSRIVAPPGPRAVYATRSVPRLSNPRREVPRAPTRLRHVLSHRNDRSRAEHDAARRRM